MKKREFLFILISSSILVFAWIVFSILESAMSSTISESLQVQTAAIPGTFNTKLIQTVKTRKQITPVNIDAVVVSPTPGTATQSATPIPTISSILQPTSTPIPTP